MSLHRRRNLHHLHFAQMVCRLSPELLVDVFNLHVAFHRRLKPGMHDAMMMRNSFPGTGGKGPVRA